MAVLGMALSLPLIALALALSVLPVWFAAKVVGAGRQEFLRVAAALVLAIVLAGMVLGVAGGWGLLLAPLVVVVTLSRMLETSYLGAFVLCVLALAFQVAISKVFGALASH